METSARRLMNEPTRKYLRFDTAVSGRGCMRWIEKTIDRREVYDNTHQLHIRITCDRALAFYVEGDASLFGLARMPTHTVFEVAHALEPPEEAPKGRKARGTLTCAPEI